MQNQITIREATPADYVALAQAHTTLSPDNPVTAAAFEKVDQNRDPQYHHQRWVALKHKQIVGLGIAYQTSWFYHPQQFRLKGFVLPEYRKQGIGLAMIDHITAALQPLKPIAFIANTYENKPESLRFLTMNGFEVFVCERELRLDVPAFELADYPDYDVVLNQYDVQIKTAAQLVDDPERDQKLFDLGWELSLDAPNTELQITRSSFEDFFKDALHGQFSLQDGFFVALHEGKYIGLTHLMLNGNEGLYQGLTGVKRDFRRKGLALVLKLTAIAYAQTMGKTVIVTNNDVANQSMLTLNERLGYVRQPDKLFLKKVLTESEKVTDNG